MTQEFTYSFYSLVKSFIASASFPQTPSLQTADESVLLGLAEGTSDVLDQPRHDAGLMEDMPAVQSHDLVSLLALHDADGASIGLTDTFDLISTSPQ